MITDQDIYRIKLTGDRPVIVIVMNRVLRLSMNFSLWRLQARARLFQPVQPCQDSENAEVIMATNEVRR